MEILKGRETEYASFYINCGGNNGAAPTINDLSLSTSAFVLDESKGIITFNHSIPTNVYSPIYVYATIWLELDGVSGMSSIVEREFSKEITIVQYPPLYITPDQSVEHSVFVKV